MHLAKFVHTQTGRYVMSVILGFGLASLFRVVCKDRNCIVLKAPPLEEVKPSDIYKYDEKCYSFTKEHTTCNKNKKTVLFA